MLKRALRWIAVALVVCLVFSLNAASVLAFEERSGTNITIGSGEVINSDLYLAGTNINIDGTVNGDVFGVGQTININGTINGGITLAGQTVSVNGKVSTGARIAGQNIIVSGNVGRDLILASSDVTINQTAIIGGDVNVFASTSILRGQIAGNVRGSVSQMTIDGQINKDVVVIVNTLTLTPTAVISGNLTYTSENQAVIQSGAAVTGTTSRIAPTGPREPRDRDFISSVLAGVVWRIYNFVAVFIIGIVIIFAARRWIKMLALSIRNDPLPCLGWGALIFFAGPIAIFIVMLTIIGIPFGLILLIIWGILIYLTQIPVALAIGWLVLSKNRDVTSYGLLIGALALGLFILYLLNAIPVVGWIIWFFMILFGLGSLITVFRTTRRTI